MEREEFKTQLTFYLMSLGMSRDEFAHKFQVSRSTLQRWLEGSTCVHEVGRLSIINALKKLYIEKFGLK